MIPIPNSLPKSAFYEQLVKESFQNWYINCSWLDRLWRPGFNVIVNMLVGKNVLKAYFPPFWYIQPFISYKNTCLQTPVIPINRSYMVYHQMTEPVLHWTKSTVLGPILVSTQLAAPYVVLRDLRPANPKSAYLALKRILQCLEIVSNSLLQASQKTVIQQSRSILLL